MRHAPLSQIVGSLASQNCHSLNVAAQFAEWQIVGVDDSDDKNGGPNNLRAWRVYRKLSQEELAKRVHTSTNMIQYLETGERGLSLKWLRRLAPALDTTPGTLADHEPKEIDGVVHDFFATRLSPKQRAQFLRIAEALTKEESP